MKIYENLVQEDGLLKNEILTENSLIIQCQESETIFNYYLFDSIEEFKNYYFSLPKFCRNLYEIILDKPQKLRFDIDIKNVKDSDVKEPLELVLDFKKRLEEKLDTKILLYISNDIEEKKFSCHMVVTGYYAQNHEECFSLCYVLHKLADKALIPYIDFAVYNKTQSFRLEGSTKYGDSRYKYLYGNNDISSHFEEGLITNVKDCVILSPAITINRKVLKRHKTQKWYENYWSHYSIV